MRRVMIRYKIKSDQVERNEALVRDVYEELSRTQPEGFRYATVKLEDGATFVHLASYEEGAEFNLPRDSAAFGRFQDGIEERYEEPAVLTQIEEIGSYRFFDESVATSA